MTDTWDICSIAGPRKENDDYGLCETAVGACLADGIGSYPMGDAIARYACHATLNAMKEGCSARASLEYAQELVADFAKVTELPRSGAAVTALKRTDGGIEVAWLGDVLCLLLRNGNAPMEALSTPHRIENRLARYVGNRHFSPDHAACSVCTGDKIALCTDGVWSEMPWTDIQLVLAKSTTPQEACAKLVLGRHAKDNATAIVLFIG